MSYKNQKIINAFNMTSDVFIVTMAYVLSVFIRFNVFNGKVSIELYITNYIILSLIYSCAVVFVLYLLNMYGSYRFSSYLKESFYILAVNGFSILAYMGVLFVFKSFNFSRGALFIWWVLSCILLITKRVVLRAIYKSIYNNKNKKAIAVIGNGELAVQFINSINDLHSEIEYKGYISGVEKSKLGVCLGSYEELEQIIEKYDIDELVVALESHEIKFMSNIFYIADKEGVGLRIIPFYNNYLPKNAMMETVGSTKLINIRVTPLDNLFWSFVKRMIDICGSLFGLIVLSPLLLITAIGVKLSSPGPVLFRQDRIGLNKNPFKMYKFRSMRVNAKETTGWSTDRDPRKTPFGSFIRKYSIDELPQLLNVLKGDMSLIGPRPEIPFYVRQFKEEVPLYLLRHQVRPGMTGWAQVHGLRGDTSIEDRVVYDIWYIENWSLWLDIKILWKTIFGGLKNSEELVKRDKETV